MGESTHSIVRLLVPHGFNKQLTEWRANILKDVEYIRDNMESEKYTIHSKRLWIFPKREIDIQKLKDEFPDVFDCWHFWIYYDDTPTLVDDYEWSRLWELKCLTDTGSRRLMLAPESAFTYNNWMKKYFKPSTQEGNDNE